MLTSVVEEKGLAYGAIEGVTKGQGRGRDEHKFWEYVIFMFLTRRDGGVNMMASLSGGRVGYFPNARDKCSYYNPYTAVE